MSLQWRDAAATPRTANGAYLRSVDGTNVGDLKTIADIKLRTVNGTSAGDLKLVYRAAVTVAASPTSGVGESASSIGPVTSNTVTVNVAGGSPPYTHSWAIISGAGITITSPSAAATTFSANPAPFADVLGTARDTVTDAHSNTVTIDVPLGFRRI